MDSDLLKKAIQDALSGNWKSAISLNTQILKQNPKDPDALNRLGRAYLETGQKTKAITAYSKVLKIDKFNTIAQKSLEQLKNLRINRHHSLPSSVPPPVFLEEPGVTRTVTLVRLGDPKIISALHPGDSVLITPREHCVSAVSTSNQHLGRLPDDLASRLLPLLKAGNQYNAWVKAIDIHPDASPANKFGLKVLIREISRSPKYKNFPSFPITEKLSYAAFTPPELVHDEKPDTSAHEDQDDAYSSSADSDAPDLESIPTAQE